MGHNAPNKFRTFRIGSDSVEKVALDRAVDAGARQLSMAV